MHALTAGVGGKAPLILNLGTTRGVVRDRHRSLASVTLVLDTH